AAGSGGGAAGTAASPRPPAPPPASSPVGSGSSAQRLDGHTTPRVPTLAWLPPFVSRPRHLWKCTLESARARARAPRPGWAAPAPRTTPPTGADPRPPPPRWLLLSDRLDGRHQVDQALAL